MSTLFTVFHSIQKSLFPWLEETFDPLTKKEQHFVQVVNDASAVRHHCYSRHPTLLSAYLKAIGSQISLRFRAYFIAWQDKYAQKQQIMSICLFASLSGHIQVDFQRACSTLAYWVVFTKTFWNWHWLVDVKNSSTQVVINWSATNIDWPVDEPG